MVDKKGVSLAIAWVLLLGLSITLAIFVGTWLKKVSEDTGEAVIEDAIRDQRCGDTVLVVNWDCTGDTIDYRNNGVFNIVKIKCRQSTGLVDVGISTLVPSGIESQALNICLDVGLDNTDVIPVIEIDGVEVACAEKSVRVTC